MAWRATPRSAQIPPFIEPATTHSLYIPQPLNDQHKSLLAVAHPSKEEDHFRYKVPFLADFVSLFKAVVIAGTQVAHELRIVILGIQSDLQATTN